MQPASSRCATRAVEELAGGANPGVADRGAGLPGRGDIAGATTDTASGKHADRPELDKALAYLREGDVLVITRLSRAMRSLKHLLALAEELRERGVGLVVLKQQIDTTTPTGRLVSMFSARSMSSSAS